MDPLHLRLTRLGLAAIGEYGFVLAGGYAVQAHGFVIRPSDDVDLFTNVVDVAAFRRAVEAVCTAYTADGLSVEVEMQSELFARLRVTDEADRATKVELGYDWRSRPPAAIDIGPVLHPDDAVANKVTTLFGRAEVRDYIDVNAALASGRYAGDELLEMAAEHDAGFDQDMFAQALRAVDQYSDADYADYGLETAMRARLNKWAARIADR